MSRLWAVDSGADPASLASPVERVLPTGSMHLVIRLSPAPLTLFGNERGEDPRVLGHSLVGGTRSTYYVRSVAEPTYSVGAQLVPGASELLFGVPAGELAERHTPLADLWGRGAELAREQLAEASGLEACMDRFEALLAARLPRVRGLHPAVAQALGVLDDGARVAEVVERSGLSHRAFTALFRQVVGLTPKLWTRVRRFQRALTSFDASRPLVELSHDAGYADQAHFSREFSEFAGVSPGQYRALAPASENHVPVLRRGSNSFKTR